MKLFLWKVDKPSYEEWADLVEESISYEVDQISRHKNDLHDLDEDALTSVLVIALNSLGLHATSARVNGNCDLTVSYSGEFLWLGEAKIFTGVAHVWGGYLQLTTRYATGMPNSSRGGMLLYCAKDSALALLAEWRAALKEAVQPANDRDGRHPLTFLSSDVSRSSGLSIELVHFGFPLFHSPKDGVDKLPAGSFKAAKEAKEQARSAQSGEA